MLLRAGLAEHVVSAVANWQSDMVKHYGRRVLLEPSLVEPYPFYNPAALSSLYNKAQEAETGNPPPAKKRKK